MPQAVHNLYYGTRNPETRRGMCTQDSTDTLDSIVR